MEQHRYGDMKASWIERQRRCLKLQNGVYAGEIVAVGHKHPVRDGAIVSRVGPSRFRADHTALLTSLSSYAPGQLSLRCSVIRLGGMIRAVLVRHGETEWNKTHRLQGQSHIDLAETGIAQAQAAGLYVRGQNPVRGYVSPLRRTHQTFEQFGLGFAPEERAGLIEQNLGHWEGMKTATAKTEDADLYKAWKRGEGTPPSGEAPEAVVERMKSTFCEIIRSSADAEPTPSVDTSYDLRTVVMISHGTSSKALLEGLGLMNRSDVISLTAAAVSVIDVPLHGGPLSSSLPKGGVEIDGGPEAEAEIIRGLTDEQIQAYAKLRMYNLSPEVLAAAASSATASSTP